MNKTGFTLIELVVTMTTGSALMVLSIGLLQQSMRLASTARHRAESHRTLDRLANEFRRDVHRAKQCTVDQTNRIDLKMSDTTEISYIAQSNRVSRLEQRIGSAAQNEAVPLRRESYDLGEGGSCSFERSDRPRRASMTIVTASAAGTRTDRHVTAGIGRLVGLEESEVSP